MGLEEALFLGKNLAKNGVSHSRSLVEFFFFFFLERLERIVSFLFFVHLLSFVVVRINVEFVKLTIEYGYCVLVSLEINLFIIRGLF